MSKLALYALRDLEVGLARTILATVVEATPFLGKPPTTPFVAAVLAGRVTDEVIRSDAQRLTTFRSLRDWPVKAIRAVIDSLIDRQPSSLLATVSSGPRGRLVVTAEGRALLEGGSAFPANLLGMGLIDGAVEPYSYDLAVRSGLVDALRRARARWAAELDAPEWGVFSEAILRVIAASLPTTAPELIKLTPGQVWTTGQLVAIPEIVLEHKPVIERLKTAPVSS